MFIQNKYTKWYYSLTNRAQQRAKTRKEAKALLGYIEKHHIIPECFFTNRKRKGPPGWLEGNSNDLNNYAYLTAHEHFICHWLLTKMADSRAKASMYNALNGMKRKNKNQERYETKVTGRVYARIRPIIARQSSELNKGRTQSTESNMARSKATKGIPKSDSTKQNMRKPKSNTDNMHKSKSAEHNKKNSDAQKGNTHGRGNKGKKYGPIRNAVMLAQGTHASQQKKFCVYCLKDFDSANFKRWHGDNCRLKR